MPSSIFESNLAALARLNPNVVEQIRSARAPDKVEFVPTGQGVPTVVVDGVQLASRHRPLEEGERWAKTIDIRAHSAIAVLGFGAGYHVGALAERLGKSGLIVVFEPDTGLLRAVLERVDCRSWLERTNLVLVTDADDRAGLAHQMRGSEAIVAQGTTIVDHGPSAKRLGAGAGRFAKSLADVIATMRTTMATTLVHAATTCRNLVLNLDHYAAGSGITDLAGLLAGRPAILVAAGPSLGPNMHLLENPALRDRAMIIAVQTCLRPLLRRGIRPHFVTALDYHEISSQFYEDLDPEVLRDVTLLCEPKVNHGVIVQYPGPVRCVGNGFLDRLLGPVRRPMGEVTAGSTVAHLSFFAAQYLGCDPIVLLGQDLAFTDNLYYGPGAAIHDQWAVEINAFNTIEMMEWARIARMKTHLRRGEGHGGQRVLLDEQMATYLAQFEREFARAPQRIVDAGFGSLKKHTEARAFEEVVADVLAGPELPEIPVVPRSLNRDRLGRARRRVVEVRRDAQRLIELSRKTAGVLNEMLAKQDRPDEMGRLFKSIDELRRRVDQLGEIHELITLVNQLGVFKRMKADRQIDLAEDMTPMERQRAQLERDRLNVEWIIDAATEFTAMLNESLDVLEGKSVDSRINPERLSNHARPDGTEVEDGEAARRRRVAVMVWVDPELGGLKRERDLYAGVGDSTVLELTLARLSRCAEIDSIVLLVPEDCAFSIEVDVEALGKPVIVRRVERPESAEPAHARAAARHWSRSSWRGGVGGMTIYDEIIEPGPMHEQMIALELDAVLVVGADWSLVDPSGSTGCDAIVKRYRQQPEAHRFVFSQAPPGLCGCVVARSLMKDMASHARQYTAGAMLSYIPSIPQLDPIGKDACVKLPSVIRTDPGRYTLDAPERIGHVRSCLDADAALFEKTGVELIEAISVRRARLNTLQYVEIDITTRTCLRDGDREATDTAAGDLRELFEEIGPLGAAVTLGIDGDPLLHPEFDRIVKDARSAGVAALHVRTDLPGDGDAERLLGLPIDVITVNVLADTAGSYEALTGSARFDELIGRLEKLINAKNRIVDSANTLQRPWIVPRMWRHRTTLVEQQNFVDRWLHFVGAALVTASPERAGEVEGRALIEVPTPPAAQRRIDRESLAIDYLGYVRGVGQRSPEFNVFANGLTEVWERVAAMRISPSERDRAEDEAILSASSA